MYNHNNNNTNNKTTTNNNDATIIMITQQSYYTQHGITNKLANQHHVNTLIYEFIISTM